MLRSYLRWTYAASMRVKLGHAPKRIQQDTLMISMSSQHDLSYGRLSNHSVQEISAAAHRCFGISGTGCAVFRTDMCNGGGNKEASEHIETVQ
jgi:hypothetical protein